MKKLLTFLFVAIISVCCTIQIDAQTRKRTPAKTTQRTSNAKRATAAKVTKPYKGTFEYAAPNNAYVITMVLDLYNKTVEPQNGEGKCYGTIEVANERGATVYDITEVQYLNHNGASVHLVGGSFPDEGFCCFTIQEEYGKPNALVIDESALIGSENYHSVTLKRKK